MKPYTLNEEKMPKETHPEHKFRKWRSHKKKVMRRKRRKADKEQLKREWKHVWNTD